MSPAKKDGGGKRSSGPDTHRVKSCPVQTTTPTSHVGRQTPPHPDETGQARAPAARGPTHWRATRPPDPRKSRRSQASTPPIAFRKNQIAERLTLPLNSCPFRSPGRPFPPTR